MNSTENYFHWNISFTRATARVDLDDTCFENDR